jgi:hypothetical protein
MRLVLPTLLWKLDSLSCLMHSRGPRRDACFP